MAAPPSYDGTSLLSGGDNVPINPVQGGGGGEAPPPSYNESSMLSGGDNVPINPVQGGGQGGASSPLDNFTSSEEVKQQNTYFEFYRQSTYGPDLIAHTTSEYDTYADYVATRSADLWAQYSEKVKTLPPVLVIPAAVKNIVVVPPIQTESVLLGLVKDLGDLNILTSANTIQEGFMVIFMGIEEVALKDNIVILDCLNDEKCAIIKEYAVYPHEHKNNRGIIISAKGDAVVPTGFANQVYTALDPKGPVPAGFVYISYGEDTQMLKAGHKEFHAYINTLRGDKHPHLTLKTHFVVARLNGDTNVPLYSLRIKPTTIDAFIGQVDDATNTGATAEAGLPNIKESFEIRRCAGFQCAVDSSESGKKNKSLLEDWYHGRFTNDEANFLNTMGIRPSYCNDMFKTHGGCSFVIANILRYASLTECFNVDKIDLMTQKECDLVRFYLNIVQKYTHNLNLEERDEAEKAKLATIAPKIPAQDLPPEFKVITPKDFAILASQDDGIGNLQFLNERDIKIEDYKVVLIAKKSTTGGIGQHVNYALAPKRKPLPKHQSYTFIEIPIFAGASSPAETAAPVAAPAATPVEAPPAAAPVAPPAPSPVAAPVAPPGQKRFKKKLKGKKAIAPQGQKVQGQPPQKPTTPSRSLRQT
jgi:hypothetical protein